MSNTRTGATLDRSRIEIKLGDYGVCRADALADPSLHLRTQEYRRSLAARMMALDKAALRQKLPACDYLVSPKVDGEFTVLVVDGDAACTVNPGGTVRTGLPFMEEAAQLLATAGVKRALVAGHLINQTTRGASIDRMVLNYDRGHSIYRVVRRLPLASPISPQFLRRREDKSVQPCDLRVQQVADVGEVPMKAEYIVKGWQPA